MESDFGAYAGDGDDSAGSVSWEVWDTCLREEDWAEDVGCVNVSEIRRGDGT